MMTKPLSRVAVILALCATTIQAQSQAPFNGGHAFYPAPPRAVPWQFDTTNFQINASGEVVVLVAKMPVAGTIDRFATIVTAVANAPDNGLRFSLQGVSATTGLNYGTIIESTNAFATIASGSVTTGWLDPGAFATSHTVTRGALLAFVLDIPTFTAGDDLIVRGVTHSGTTVTNLPYSVRATNSISGAVIPIIVAHYTDNGGFWQQISPLILPASGALTAMTFDTGTTPDEVGAVFIPSQPCRLNMVTLPIGLDAAAANFDVILYDSANNVLDTVSYDGDQVATGGLSQSHLFDHWLSAPVTLTAGSTYRIVVKPTSTNNVRISYMPIADAGIGAVPGKLANFYLTARTDAGAWTNYNAASDYRFPTFVLAFDAFSDGVSGVRGHIIGGQ
jgi:hypothetical protein